MPDSSPLISVILPVFNVGRFVEECLQSVCTQTYQNLEVVVVNDGSTDDSRAKCADFASRDPRIRIIDQENAGLSAARNTGLDSAQGEYVLFVDSDDVLAANHIEALYRALVGACADISITNLTFFTDAFHPCNRNGKAQNLLPEEAVKVIFYQGEFDTCAPGKLYRSNLWTDIRFPIGYVHEDLPTVYKTFLSASSIVFFQSETYGYRRRTDGLNHSKTTDKKARTLDLIDDVVNHIDQAYPLLSTAVRCFRTSFCFHLILNADETSLSATMRNRIMRSVRQDRFTVLGDTEARRKTRIACLLTYCGFRVVSTAFNMVAHR